MYLAYWSYLVFCFFLCLSSLLLTYSLWNSIPFLRGSTMSLMPFDNDDRSFGGPIQDNFCGDRDIFGVNNSFQDCNGFNDDFDHYYDRYEEESFNDYLYRYGRDRFSFRMLGFRIFCVDGGWKFEILWWDIIVLCLVLGIIVLRSLF